MNASRPAPRWIVTAVAAVVVGGCSTTNATTSTWGSDRAPWCPATLPQEGAACTLEPDAPGVAYAACEYGTQAHCSTMAFCARTTESPTWGITPPDPACAGNPPSCPASFENVGGAEVCSIGTSCMYPTAHCVCSACGSSPGSSNVCGTQDAGTGWGCEPWGSAGDGCRSTPVLLGTACTPPSPSGGVCGSNSGQIAICVNGYWSLGLGGP